MNKQEIKALNNIMLRTVWKDTNADKKDVYIIMDFLEKEITIIERLEYLRGEIEAECISYEEIAELQGLAEHIEAGDVLLLEWAGVPEEIPQMKGTRDALNKLKI